MPPRKRRGIVQSKAQQTSGPTTRAQNPKPAKMARKNQKSRPDATEPHVQATAGSIPPPQTASIDLSQPGPRGAGASIVGTLSDFSTSDGPKANPASPRNLAGLKQEANRLLQASVAEKTWQTYNAAYESFNQFRYQLNLPVIWPVPVDHIVQFLAYLSLKGRSSSCMRTYISGLSHTFKIQGMADNTKSFLVTKILEGARGNPIPEHLSHITS